MMKYTIRGTIMQVVDVELDAGESVYTESGGMAWMSDNLLMETNVKGGMLKGFGRMLSGESLFMTTYSCPESTGRISFANEFPGTVSAMDLEGGQSLICQRDAFMFAEADVQLSIEFRKRLGAGIFGGEGFILQRVTGPGLVFLEVAGELSEYMLKPGEVLKVDPGHIAFYEPTVDFDISRVKGLKNMFFGGEGLFLATLRGPGKVWLQSMPLANLARRLNIYMPRPSK